MSKKCIVCETELSWKSARRKFCSTSCKSKFYQKDSYIQQQIRGRRRKIELIKSSGGKCSKCGYSKNYAALHFHHIDPNFKEISLDVRRISNSKMEMLIEESKKCLLLCANCHAELHNPECIFEN